jgi:hypothetical protein
MPPSGGAAVAAGERSVAIGGDVVDSVIVTGDHATVELKVGSTAGALLALVRGRRKPKQRARPTPLDVRPPPFANRINRLRETAELLADDGAAVSLCGEAGLGKTYVVATALQESAALPRDGVVYLFAKGKPLDDLLQELFEQFYECRPPFKNSAAQIARDLAEKRALVVLDSLELERDEAQQLLVALPRCRFVAASRERRFWEGPLIPLHGLATADALALVEQELERPLEDTERDAAEQLCAALAGHPLKIRQAISLVHAGETTLGRLVDRLGAGDAARQVTQAALAPLSPEERRVLATLAVVGGETVGEQRLAEAAAVSDAGAVAAALERRHLVESHSPRYSLAGGLEAELRQIVPLAEPLERALGAFIAWAEAARDEPVALLQEAPALLQLLLHAFESGHEQSGLALARIVDSAFAVGRRFGAWATILDGALAAARRIGDRSSEAWALHQLGTRAYCLGDAGHAEEALREALRIRRALGAETEAAASAYNLAVVAGAPPPLLARIARLPLATLAVVTAALVAVSGGGAALVWWKHHDQGRGGGGGTTVALTLVKAGRGTGVVESRPRGIDCGGRCTGAFASGSRVTLSAASGRGSKFGGWSGGGCSGTSTCTVSISAPVRVTARFDAAAAASLSVELGGSGAGTVQSTPAGVDCPTRCRAAYARGSRVTLVAQARAGSTFTGWSTAGCGTRPACMVDVRGPTSARASFARAAAPVQVAVSPSGDGRGTVTSKPPGIVCGSRCKASFKRGSAVVLTATASAGSTFAGWSGACSGTAPCRLTASNDDAVGARFERTPSTNTLTVVPRGDGSGRVISKPSGIDCGATCTASFPPGAHVVLEAQPLQGSVFAGWSGGGCSGTDQCIVPMAQSQTVTAVFNPAPPPVTLTASTGGGGAGTVTSDDGAISSCSGTCTATYVAGKTVTLRATPGSGSLFVGWKSADCTGSGSCTLTLDVSKHVFAVFAIRPPA